MSVTVSPSVLARGSRKNTALGIRTLPFSSCSLGCDLWSCPAEAAEDGGARAPGYPVETLALPLKADR